MIWNILALIFAIICLGLMIRIYQKVSGWGRLVLIIALAYLVVVRTLIIMRDTIPTFDFMSSQWAFGFYPLMALGLWILLKEIKSTLGRKK